VPHVGDQRLGQPFLVDRQVRPCRAAAKSVVCAKLNANDRKASRYQEEKQEL
jgi:hypothetical protein